METLEKIKILKEALYSVDILSEINFPDATKAKNNAMVITGNFKAFDMFYAYSFILLEEKVIIETSLKFKFQINERKKIKDEKSLKITNEFNKDYLGISASFLSSAPKELKVEFSHDVFIPNKNIDLDFLSGIIFEMIKAVGIGPVAFSKKMTEFKIDYVNPFK